MREILEGFWDGESFEEKREIWKFGNLKWEKRKKRKERNDWELLWIWIWIWEFAFYLFTSICWNDKYKVNRKIQNLLYWYKLLICLYTWNVTRNNAMIETLFLTFFHDFDIVFWLYDDLIWLNMCNSWFSSRNKIIHVQKSSCSTCRLIDISFRNCFFRFWNFIIIFVQRSTLRFND